MYNELYAAWRGEIQESSLGGLPPDFYVRLASYLFKLREETSKLPDKKSVKSNLLDHEAQNVRRMLQELLETRYKKIMVTITQNQKVPSELLSTEESKMSSNFLTFADAYRKFTSDLLQGQIVETPTLTSQPIKVDAESPQKRVTLRFAKNTPVIIGMDMKPYGPFKAEDVASLPAENAKIFVKQGLAVLIEVS